MSHNGGALNSLISPNKTTKNLDDKLGIDQDTLKYAHIGTWCHVYI